MLCPSESCCVSGDVGVPGCVERGWTNDSNNHKDAPCSLAKLGDTQALLLLQLGLLEETRAKRELLGTMMGMPAHLPGCK